MTEQSIILARTIRTIGWSAVAISIIAIISETIGLVLYNPVQHLEMLFRMIPKDFQKELKEPIDALRYSRIWSFYTILYFVVVLAGAYQFVQFRSVGRAVLETAAWIGVANGCVDSYLSYVFWKSFHTILSSAMGNANFAARNLSPYGMLSIAGSCALWIVPSILLIVYLRKPAVKSFMKKPEDHSAIS